MHVLRASAALLAVGLALLPRATRADEFSEFRIPEHRWLLWTATLGAGGGQYDRSGFANGMDWGYSGSGQTSLQGWRESDRFLTRYGASLGLAGSRSRSSIDDLPRPTDDPGLQGLTNSQWLKSADERWAVSVGHRAYPWAFPIGLEVSGSAAGRYGQRLENRHTEAWFRDTLESRVINDESREQWIYRYDANVSAGAGFGRVRDATAVYDAMVIERRLLESGALARPLSPAARARLAGILYLREGYASVHERPAKEVWDAIEELLASDGALAGDHVPPYALLRAAEPAIGGGSRNDMGLFRSPVARVRGWFVGGSGQLVHYRELARNDFSFRYSGFSDGVPVVGGSATSASHVRSREDFIAAGPSGEWHQPWGEFLQFDASASFNVPLRGRSEGFSGNSNVSGTWIAADRWIASALVSYRRVSVHDQDSGYPFARMDFWGWDYRLSGIHYVEDNLQLAASVGGRQARDFNYRRDLSASLALTWALVGRFQAPGLMEPSRFGW